MVITVGWTAKVKDSVSYADMTTLTDHLEYKLTWAMNQPAELELLLNDDSGANTQTYGSAYMGTSAVVIEQPTNTEIFRGRIGAAVPDVTRGTLTLHGAGWLSQLEDRLVIYDTREILDPNDTNSLREYYLRPRLNAGTRCNFGYENAGDTYVHLSIADTGNQTDDAYDGMRLIFPNSYLGKQTDTVFAYDETVVHYFGRPIATDDGDESDTWEDDGNCHTVQVTDNVELAWFSINYAMKSFTASSGKVGSYDGMRVTVIAEPTDDTEHVHVGLNTAPDGTGDTYWIGEFPLTLGDTSAVTLKFPQEAVDLVDTDTAWSIRIICTNNTLGEDTGIKIYQVYVEIDYTVDTALTTHTYTLTSSECVEGSYNLYQFDSQTLITDGVIDWWPFHITDKTSVYIAELLSTYDELYALTSAITATTNYVGRHYHRMTPLAIIRDLAQVDGTDFWLAPWDGDSLDFYYNDSYALNGEPTWGDSDVLHWQQPSQRLRDVINEVFVEGYTAGEYKATGSDSDAGSITSYGRRSKYVQNPDIGTSDDCDALADAMVERSHDLPFHVGALLDGYSTVNLGDVVNVNSTKLALANQKYVVTRKEYDSRTATSRFFLTPRQDSLNLAPHISNLFRDVRDRIHRLETGFERPKRYTVKW